MQRAPLLAALALTGALLVTGCGSPAASTSSTTSTTSTTSTSTSTTSAASTTSTTTSQPASGTVDKDALLKELADGNASVKTMTTTMQIGLTSAGKTTSTTMVMAIDQSVAKHLRASITMNIGVGDMQIVMDGDNYYLQMAGTWYKMTKAQLEKSGAAAPDTASQSDTLNKLSPKIRKVELIGTEQVGGTATKHYRLTLDGSAFSELGGDETPAASTDTIPYELWVDGNGVMRKYAVTMDGKENSMSLTGVVDKINQPVTITVPKDAKEFPS